MENTLGVVSHSQVGPMCFGSLEADLPCTISFSQHRVLCFCRIVHQIGMMLYSYLLVLMFQPTSASKRSSNHGKAPVRLSTSLEWLQAFPTISFVAEAYSREVYCFFYIMEQTGRFLINLQLFFLFIS